MSAERKGLVPFFLALPTPSYGVVFSFFFLEPSMFHSQFFLETKSPLFPKIGFMPVLP
jgi:hypothetical protein